MKPGYPGTGENPERGKPTLAVTSARLSDGTNHTAEIVPGAKARKICARMTNSGYRKTGH
jgi:hypothetical protein